MARAIKDPWITYEDEGCSIYVAVNGGYVLGSHQDESIEMTEDITRAAEAFGKRIRRLDDVVRKSWISQGDAD